MDSPHPAREVLKHNLSEDFERSAMEKKMVALLSFPMKSRKKFKSWRWSPYHALSRTFTSYRCPEVIERCASGIGILNLKYGLSNAMT